MCVNNDFKLDSILAPEAWGSRRMEPLINETEEKSHTISNFILSIRQFIL